MTGQIPARKVVKIGNKRGQLTPICLDYYKGNEKNKNDCNPSHQPLDIMWIKKFDIEFGGLVLSWESCKKHKGRPDLPVRQKSFISELSDFLCQNVSAPPSTTLNLGYNMKSYG